jgi:hypothetical protein
MEHIKENKDVKQPKLDNKELFTRVNHLEQSSSAMQADITAIKADLNRVIEMLSVSGRTNWSVIAAFITVGVMIFTPILYNIKSDIDKERSDRLQQQQALMQFQADTNNRLIERAKFMGRQEAFAEIDRSNIDDNSKRIFQMQTNRFTDEDGEKLSDEIEKKIEFLQSLLIDEIKKNEP